jgi:aspartate aminotransferase-like enzyme
MEQTDLLMIPGPTPLPEAVREALAKPAMGHRSPGFKKVLERVLPRLQWVFQTQNDVFLYTASGTGAMEASLINTLNPGDKTLALVCGVFSARWAEVAESLGIEVERLTVAAGEHNPVEALAERLAQDTSKQIKAVMVTHSETSTGVLNPLQEYAKVIQAHGALSIVDAVTSMGAISVPVDDWGLDLVISGSQKGFMIPPGLSFLSVSEKAWAAHKACQNPGFYFNFQKYKKAQDDFTTPYTPATALILGLDVALEMMEKEGLPAIFERHHQLRQMTRSGLSALGLDLMVKEERYASTAATSAYLPSALSVADVRSELKSRFGIQIADGQKDLKGKIIRVGHLGYVSERNTLMTLSTLEAVLSNQGAKGFPPGAGVAAAMKWVNKQPV